MSQLSKEFWTKELNASGLVINSSFGLTAVSLTLVSGTAFITGSLNCNGVASTKINLVIGQSILISTDALSFVKYLKIETTGVLNIIGR